MSIIDSFKRVERAGSEFSKQTQKLKLAVADIVGHIETIVSEYQNVEYHGGIECYIIRLPRGYVLYNGSFMTPTCFKNDGETIREDQQSLSPCLIDYYRRQDIIKFSQDVVDGFINELAEHLEKINGGIPSRVNI